MWLVDELLLCSAYLLSWVSSAPLPLCAGETLKTDCSCVSGCCPFSSDRFSLIWMGGGGRTWKTSPETCQAGRPGTLRVWTGSAVGTRQLPPPPSDPHCHSPTHRTLTYFYILSFSFKPFFSHSVFPFLSHEQHMQCSAPHRQWCYFVQSLNNPTHNSTLHLRHTWWFPSVWHDGCLLFKTATYQQKLNPHSHYDVKVSKKQPWFKFSLGGSVINGLNIHNK